MGYLRSILNCPKNIALYDLTHMMSMNHLEATNVEISMIDSGSSLVKEFIELILMNPLIVLNLTINKVYSCHDYVCGSWARDTKYILWMDDHVLIMTYKFLAKGSQNIIYWIQHEVIEDDFVVKMESSALDI